MFPNTKHNSSSESQIGKRIRALRKEKRLTLEGLATMTGFTKGYLSKLEKSEKAPPVSTLGTIARALGVTISNLLGENSSAISISLVKKSDRPIIVRDGTRFGYSYEAVAHSFTKKMMEPFVLTLPRRPKKQMIFQHEGQELLYVLEGTMRFHHGQNELVVEEGDCIYFDAGVPHFGESMGDRDVKCFMVIWNPNSGG